MSILPCLHSVLALPGALFRKQIVLPAVHGADDAPPERLSARPRRLATPYPAPGPPDRALAAHVRRVRAGQGQARRRPAPPSTARDILGRRARPGPLSATAIGLTSRAELALDIAGPGWQASLRCSPARTGGGARGRNQHGADGHCPGTPPLARVTPKRRTRGGRRLR